MQKLKKYIKLVSIVSAVIMLLSCATFSTNAASGTIYESESNDTALSANRTYDDYDNYGTINNSVDIDWWVVTFSTEGMVNFYLGNIPSGCDYNLYLYKNDGITLIASSRRISNSYDQVRCHVTAGGTYRIKIVSANTGYSSSNYLFRTKWTAMYDARMFVHNITDGEATDNLVSEPAASNSYTYIWNMGFSGTWYLNNSVASAYSVLPTSDIFLAYGHAGPGRIRFDTSASNQTRLYANNPNISSTNRNLSSADLSKVDLIMFVGCKSGLTDSVSGNLVDTAISKGAFASMGWNVEISSGGTNEWVKKFFYYCSLGQTVYEASINADEAILKSSYSAQYTKLIDRYITEKTAKMLVLKEAK